MSDILLIGDTKSQKKTRALANQLYTSGVFKRARQYAVKRGDRWFILSAKHGLITPNTVIDPYDTSINDLSAADRFQLSQQIIQELLKQKITSYDTIIVLANSTYREMLEPIFLSRNINAEYPFERLGVVKQMKWLDRAIQE